MSKFKRPVKMQNPKFIHLRVHTAYSLSEGAIKIGDLIHYLHQKNIPAIAVTDSGNMFGGKAFSKYASEEGVKPILGCIFFMRNPDSDNLLLTKGKAVERDKLILLVMNSTGYENIMRAVKKTMYKRLGKEMPKA